MGRSRGERDTRTVREQQAADRRRIRWFVIAVVIVIGVLTWWLSPTSIPTYANIIGVGLVILFYWSLIRDRR